MSGGRVGMSRIAASRRHRWVSCGWIIGVLGLGAPGIAYAQEPGHGIGNVRFGAGLSLPREDLPARDTPWGVGQGRLRESVFLFVDFGRGAEWAGFAVYGHLLGAPAAVDWRVGDNSVAGLSGAGLVGVQHGLALGERVRVFIRVGLGSAFYVLAAGGACIPEDPACGLSSLYAGNHLDFAAHVGAGIEALFGGTAVSVEVGSLRSRFNAGELEANQRTELISIGLRM